MIDINSIDALQQTYNAYYNGDSAACVKVCRLIESICMDKNFELKRIGGNEFYWERDVVDATREKERERVRAARKATKEGQKRKAQKDKD